MEFTFRIKKYIVETYNEQFADIRIDFLRQKKCNSLWQHYTAILVF